jgi:hypothetical protein
MSPRTATPTCAPTAPADGRPAARRAPDRGPSSPLPPPSAFTWAPPASSCRSSKCMGGRWKLLLIEVLESASGRVGGRHRGVVGGVAGARQPATATVGGARARRVGWNEVGGRRMGRRCVRGEVAARRETPARQIASSPPPLSWKPHGRSGSGSQSAAAEAAPAARVRLAPRFPGSAPASAARQVPVRSPLPGKRPPPPGSPTPAPQKRPPPRGRFRFALRCPGSAPAAQAGSKLNGGRGTDRRQPGRLPSRSAAGNRPGRRPLRRDQSPHRPWALRRRPTTGLAPTVRLRFTPSPHPVQPAIPADPAERAAAVKGAQRPA